MKKIDYIEEKLNGHGYAVDFCVRSKARTARGIRKLYFGVTGDDFYEKNECWEEDIASGIKEGFIEFPDENHVAFLSDMGNGNRQTFEELLERVQW